MFHVQRFSNASIIIVENDLDIGSSPALKAAIALAEADTYRSIIVSLDRCMYCDATGLKVLLDAKKRLGQRLIVVVPSNSPVYRIFVVTSVASYLSIVEDIDDALAASKHPRPFDGERLPIAQAGW